MEITKNIIKDLMPMYLANEVSDDTRAMVDEYLKSDTEFAEKYKMLDVKLPKDIKMSLNREDQLKAFLKVKQLRLIRTIVLALIFSGMILAVLAAFITFVR